MMDGRTFSPAIHFENGSEAYPNERGRNIALALIERIHLDTRRKPSIHQEPYLEFSYSSHTQKKASATSFATTHISA